MKTDYQKLEKQAARVLRTNDCDDYTVPSSPNYNHQWLWDSCFIAIGLSHINPDRAATELTSLLEGQWDNGMIPHMIFRKRKFLKNSKFSAGSFLYGGYKTIGSPKHLSTSCLTQPPIVAEAVSRVAQKLGRAKRKQFLDYTLPKLISYHQWIYRERDNNLDGLMEAIHPWETGMDNTPPWMEYLKTKDRFFINSLTSSPVIKHLIIASRRDTKKIAYQERSSDSSAIRSTMVLLKLRKLKFNPDKIRRKHFLFIEDIAMNSILIRNNRVLQDLAKLRGLDLPKSLIANMKKTEDSLELSLWDKETEFYYSRDARSGQLLKIPTIASLLPIYAGSISSERMESLLNHLLDKNAFAGNFVVPSVPLNSPFFFEKKFWDGPIWINMNWLIIEGLKSNGYQDEAQKLALKTLALVEAHGEREYFSPSTGKGLGVKNFSWTAALVIDLINSRGFKQS